MSSSPKKITTSSTAEYFSKNLQQVGFSSPVKAVLTTLKEAMDNSLDACEEHGILPDIRVLVEKIGKGSTKNTDKILIRVEDNGPGLSSDQVPMVFGEYLASSKFGRGRCSRGQQGIGISAATTWAVQTSATGAQVTTKKEGQRKALSCLVSTDLKNNKGILQDKKMVPWDKPHGTIVEFMIDGRIQLNGDGGLLAYLRGTILLNPHMSLHYKLSELEPTQVDRLTQQVPTIPEATPPHPHTMKLGEFISHGRLFGSSTVKNWLEKGFSRVSDGMAHSIGKGMLTQNVASLSDQQFRDLYEVIQNTDFKPPSTDSVIALGEETLSLSMLRLGDMDYFSVVSRKPAICDFKPVQVEVAMARLKTKSQEDNENAIQVLRFANRVPLQFDRASCAIVKAISSINWKAYDLKQSKNQLPTGPYIIAVSIVSPFITFKNASKETIDASDDLVEEIRKALMKTGQQLSRHLKRENKAKELESKVSHIEKFCPILIETLCKIVGAGTERKIRAEEGLKKILGRDNRKAEKELSEAEQKLLAHIEKNQKNLTMFKQEDELVSE
jgi:DNA topoisomerase-6 subunit B